MISINLLNCSNKNELANGGRVLFKPELGHYNDPDLICMSTKSYRALEATGQGTILIIPMLI